MVEKSKWEISQQIIAASSSAMKLEHSFGEEKNKNITVGIQLKPKTKQKTNKDEYERNATRLLNYVQIYSMIEKYSNLSYRPYNETNNPDLDTWKEYPNNLTKK